MFEKTRLKIEKKAENLIYGRNLAALVVAGGLALAGCGESSQSSDQPVRSEDPLSQSLNDYRDRVNFKKKARLVLNTCAGWSNISGGITVTQNPGVDTVRSNGRTYSYFVWGTPSGNKKSPSIQYMNGPQAKVTEKGIVYGGGPSGTLLNVNLEKQEGYVAHATNRKLSSEPTVADNGQIYHTDAQTDEPIMNTVITDGPFTSERVLAVCNALEDGSAIDPFGR